MSKRKKLAQHDRWLHIAAKIAGDANEAVVQQCPRCGEQKIGHYYIADKETRIGYLCVGCGVCKKGIRISRVRVPAERPFIAMDDEDMIRGLPFFTEGDS